MRLALRWLSMCVLCLVGVCCWSVAADAATGVSSGVAEAGPLGGALVVSGSPVESEQVHAGQEAGRSNPEAVRGREESETKYEGLDPAAAESLTNATDPVLVDSPDGGPPSLPEGQRIAGFPSDYAMTVVGSGGSREVREALEPVSFEATPGERTPIILGLSELGGSFQPTTGLAPVRIPKRLSEGPALSEAGVSLTPVDATGAPLAGEGVLDGASVFYGDSEDVSTSVSVLDVDTLVKPSTFGLMMETILRSQRSPSSLFFKVGLSENETLEQESPGSGTVRVVKDGKTQAVIYVPSAHDAEGTMVPVSMTVDGDTLALMVNHPAGAFEYPITVDPRYEYYASEFTWDQEINGTGSHPTNWHFEHEGADFTGSEAGAGLGWTMQISGSHGEHERGWMVYTTRGLSHIWDFASETAQHEEGTRVESRVELDSKNGVESQHTLATQVSEPGWNDPPYCRMDEKCEVIPADNNSATYVALASGAGTGKAGENVFRAAEVAVQQEVNPEVAFDTAEETINGYPNALYGTKTWLGPNSNAVVKFTASDKGIGVEGWSSEHTNATGGWESLSSKSMIGEGRCEGIQCPSEVAETIGYSSALPDGEPKIGLDAWNAMYDSHAKENEAESLRRHTVKVDSTPPHDIALTGLLSGNEISTGEYHLKAEATDGSGTTPSSGVKSIVLHIDGKEVGSPSGACEVSSGPCTAHAEWSITGRNYAVGRHTFTVIATDNAGNVAVDEIVVTVRAASSVALSPGTLNLESGEFSLGASDVSMGPGLTVSRSYGSRHLNAGAEGPLGSQWALSLTGQEQLEVQPNGSVVFTDSEGTQAIFRNEGKGTFEAPPGDANFAMTEGELESKPAYILADAASDTKTIFTLAGSGSTIWVPAKQEGPVATDTATYRYQTAEGQTEFGLPSGSDPQGIATGPDGNLWFSDNGTSKMGKITTSGAVTEYALPSGSDPRGPAAGPDGNVWFVDELTSKVGKITTSGAITEYALPAGSYPNGITVGPDNNLWFIDGGSSKVGKSTTSGTITEYSLPAGSAPHEITAGPDGNLWFTDVGTSKIGKITTSGTKTEYSLPSGSEPHEITAGPEGKLWFTDTGTNRIGKITTSGAVTEYSVPAGSAPNGISAGPEGNLWFTDSNSNKVGKITTTGAITEYDLPAGSGPHELTAGPDGNLWYADFGSSAIGRLPTSGTIAEPLEALAPVPAGVSCSWKEKATEMKPGCRALEFKYATESTAKGEAESEWGEYRRRLAKVLAVGYNPSTKTMEEKAVAEYFYDKLGRLRAEWDPLISPALKTIYGYDAEGHVTALTEPGQESWAFTYGPSAGDSNPGRLLKVERAPTTAKLWKGEPPKNTETPKLSGSTVTGNTMSVTLAQIVQ